MTKFTNAFDEQTDGRTGELYCRGFEFSANLVGAGAAAELVNAPNKQWRRVLSQTSECRILCKASEHNRRTEEDSTVSIMYP